MKRLFTFLFLTAFGTFVSNAATFSSISSGTWNAPATWNVTGSDADGIPDTDDNVTINGGHNVILGSPSYFGTLLIQSTGILNGNSQALRGYGDFTVNGSVSGILHYVVMAPTVFSSASVYTAPGNWYTYANLTIAAGTSLIKQNYFYMNSTGVVTNLGSVRLTGGTVTQNSNNASWINGVNSTLDVAVNFPGFKNFDFTATGNTMIYNTATAILPEVYYNLTLTGGGTKSISADLTVLNDLRLNTSGGNVLNFNNFNASIGGNWTNNANTTCTNQGIITFNGSGTQTISRTGQEYINNLVLAGTGTTLLNSTLNILQNLTINSGTFDVNSTNQTVFIRGNLINNSTLNCRAGTITFSGSTLQTVSGSSNTQFYNLTLNNNSGMRMDSPQSLTNILTLITGNFNSNNNFTLISNSSSTARIAPKGAGTPSFSGNMTIQKYINARTAGYHDLSSPVLSTTIMDWDDELYMSQIGPNDGIPGPAGVDGSSGSPSVFSWDETTCNTAPNYGFEIVTGSSTPLVNGAAYEIFIGDDPNNYNGGTIDTRGVPQFGNKTVNLSYTSSQGAYAGTNLVGNPFASAVNYASCSKTNVTGSVLILDNSGNYTDYGTSPVIPPHQGFWIYASSTGANITFNETAKSTSTVTTFYRQAPNYGIKLVFSSPSSPYFNENTINFDAQSSLDFDRDLDALYLKSPNRIAPSIYMLTNSDAKLITNTINSDKEEVTIPLAIFTPKNATYYIEPTILNTDAYNFAWIEDTKTGKKYDLNSSVSILGEVNKTNYDYVLRLSKKSTGSEISQTVFDNDIIVFASENDINLKSINTTHFITEVTVYDLSGKLMLQEKNMTVESGQATKIDISSFAKGMYIVNVTDILGHQKTQKVIR